LRLAGKALLPVKQIPMAILAAMRARNSGLTTIVVTSSERSDDELVESLKKYNVPYFRGDLDSPLRRIVNALIHYSDDTTVVRLTADNIFPDGQLIELVLQSFINSNSEYMLCNGVECGVPYGVSVEVTKLSHLRESLTFAKSSYDHEHVTQYVLRKYGAVFFDKYKSLKFGSYRATVDEWEDYQKICKVFEKVIDPIAISHIKLIDILAELEQAGEHELKNKKIIIGTAHLGSTYGIANQNGVPPSLQEVERLLEKAKSSGIVYIDTARAYADSEKILGSLLKFAGAGFPSIITKILPLSDSLNEDCLETIDQAVDQSLFQSHNDLGVKYLDVLMFHRAKDLLSWDRKALKRAVYHLDRANVGEIGVSVQNPAELFQVIQIPEITCIQMPFNILDNRWADAINAILKEKKLREIKIHIRSVYLQGLLPNILLSGMAEKFPELLIIDQWLSSLVRQENYKSVAELCFSYVNSFLWVDGIVLGLETAKQLEQNISYLNGKLMNQDLIEAVNSTRPKFNRDLLNPSTWN
jgi:spore coat polysaccharide biosynthesis protein SpsF